MKNVNLKLNKVKSFVLDLIFPRECLGCGREGRYLCSQCRAQIKLTKEFYCALCHKPSEFGKICSQCQKDTALKAIWVVSDYNQKIIQDLIHNLKYDYLEEISADIALLSDRYLKGNKIFEHFQINADNTILVPVPLHKKRRLNRGFNQSELLADKLGEAAGLNVGIILSRIKNTQTQIDLNRSNRQSNVRDAFSVKGVFDKNKKIILIDDVVTTGSTLKECAEVLAKAGCSEIYGLVVAQREDR